MCPGFYEEGMLKDVSAYQDKLLPWSLNIWRIVAR